VTDFIYGNDTHQEPDGRTLAESEIPVREESFPIVGDGEPLVEAETGKHWLLTID
jgi:hypothetical protein